MNKELKETIAMTLFLIGLMVIGLTFIFLFQSWFHPYETNCRTEAIGHVCDIRYHLYWKPTLKI
jgi:hypothetical protein